MEGSKNQESTRAWYAVIILTVLAPTLGGSTALWALGTISLGTGLCFLLSPPRRSLGPYANVAFAALCALTVIAFLPADWFAIPRWRSGLQALGAHLPGTVSAQPWLSFEATVLMFLFLSWTYYLLGANWSSEARRKTWFYIALAIVALAGALTIASTLKKQIPFWPDVPEFGFFPNRNHTSNVLGIGGILVYALALRSFSEGRKGWWLWLPALALIFWALILNYSRSGVLLLGGGALAWHIYWLAVSASKRRSLIAMGGILLLLALFAWSGGKTAMRFGRSETADFFSESNGRFTIYRDATTLLRESSFAGSGLANFPPVFAMNQKFSIGPSVAIHPESSWMWLAVELGWLAPVLVALLLGWWAARCFPFEPGTNRLMRAAAFIGVCGFALHACLDVVGHHVGTLWPALLLASTALHPRATYRNSKIVSPLFRVLGVALLGAALLAFSSSFQPARLPTRECVASLEKDMDAALASQNYPAAAAAASAALRIAPLNWYPYYQRGVVESLTHARMAATKDFAVARYLLPNWPDLWLKEGLMLAAADQVENGFALWSQMLQRFPDDAEDLYGQIFQIVKLDSDLRDRWRELGRTNKRCLLAFFRLSEPVEFAVELERLFSEDPDLQTLTPNELSILFEAWYQKGDKLRLAETLREHPAWEKIAWRQLARAFADFQDYRQAFETVTPFSTPPVLPRIDARQIPLLAARFQVNRDVGNDGLQLATAQFQSGALEDALRTIQIASTAPKAPRALHYMAAQIWAGKGDWPKAWQSIAKYERVID